MSHARVRAAKLAIDGAHAVAGHDGRLGIRQASELQREQPSLTRRELGHARKRQARVEMPLDARAAIGDDLGAADRAIDRRERIEPCVTALNARQPVRLVDRDGAQPTEHPVTVGLAAQQDQPRRLASVFDELVRAIDRARDCSVEIAVVAAIELAFIAPRRQPLWRRFCGWFGRALHQPRPGRDRPAGVPAGTRVAPRARRTALPDHRGGAAAPTEERARPRPEGEASDRVRRETQPAGPARSGRSERCVRSPKAEMSHGRTPASRVEPQTSGAHRERQRPARGVALLLFVRSARPVGVARGARVSRRSAIHMSAATRC